MPLAETITRWMGRYPSVLTAYSGGVDSAVVMTAAHRALGGRALACIGVSPSYPERELDGALRVAELVGAEVRIVRTLEHEDPRYAANPADRCFFCKSELYGRLHALAEEEGFAVVADGNNATDLAAGETERPGWRAARQHGIHSPLAELGFSKEDVRALAREFELPVWNKPATPCLASRVPHGTPIVPQLLRQIERAEEAIHQMGFRIFRVRHHGAIARIELPPEDFLRAIEQREAILVAVRGAGYSFVTLDLAGFRSGSLHAAPG